MDAARLARPAPGPATVVFHSVVMQYLPEREREDFGAAVRRGRQDWVTLEAPPHGCRMEPDGERWAAIRLATWPGGEDRLLARAGYHGTPVEVAGLSER